MSQKGNICQICEKKVDKVTPCKSCGRNYCSKCHSPSTNQNFCKDCVSMEGVVSKS